MDIIKEKISQTIANLQNLLMHEEYLRTIEKTADVITTAVKNGNKLLICGNGGSAADALHVVGEFLCRFKMERNPMPAIALNANVSVLTAIGNDYSYDAVFERQLRGLGKHGDVLMGISTSGLSKNILEAFKAARKMGIMTVLLTGEKEKSIAEVSDIVIKTPSTDTPRIQEMHLLIEHIICEIVEKDCAGLEGE